ncbi:hypothetical protein NPIL_526131 [Nephila pilipes]|uniref:Uncharacterized protein n=1 Tax=Nephila pilipes TaxID=299642 RepID=A0A8X6PWD5_NEPPI|nr:hypothetical protein NPIL_526131 [Nephila pilipes]
MTTEDSQVHKRFTSPNRWIEKLNFKETIRYFATPPLFIQSNESISLRLRKRPLRALKGIGLARGRDASVTEEEESARTNLPNPVICISAASNFRRGAPQNLISLASFRA